MAIQISSDKTPKAGKSWKFSGLKDSHHIAAIIVHPENDTPKIIYKCQLSICILAI